MALKLPLSGLRRGTATTCTASIRASSVSYRPNTPFDTQMGRAFAAIGVMRMHEDVCYLR